MDGPTSKSVWTAQIGIDSLKTKEQIYAGDTNWVIRERKDGVGRN